MPELSIEAKNHLIEGGEILKQVAEILQNRCVTVEDLIAADAALRLMQTGIRAHIVTAMVNSSEEE